jgi:hypothetical protein
MGIANRVIFSFLDPNPTQHNWRNPARSAEVQEADQREDPPMTEGGGILSLLYPFSADGWNFPIDAEMLDLPLFEMGQFDMDSVGAMPWGSGLPGGA